MNKIECYKDDVMVFSSYRFQAVQDWIKTDLLKMSKHVNSTHKGGFKFVLADQMVFLEPVKQTLENGDPTMISYIDLEENEEWYRVQF